MNDLNDHASTIEMVFRELAELYGDASPEKVKERILALLDADTAAEIIEAAQRVGSEELIAG